MHEQKLKLADKIALLVVTAILLYYIGILFWNISSIDYSKPTMVG